MVFMVFVIITIGLMVNELMERPVDEIISSGKTGFSIHDMLGK